MTEMENSLVKSFNLFYKNNNIKALAHRLFQNKYSRGQYCDFLSDSSSKKYYFACECKSIDFTKYKSLNFKSRFSEADGIHQLDREHFFVEQTGRKGYLAVECRMGPGKPKECYFINMDFVYDLYKSGEKSLKKKDIISYPKLDRKKSLYLIDEKIFE
jgi:hypothetical protein